MLVQGKYYILIPSDGPKEIQLQVSKKEHERIRNIMKKPLIVLGAKSPEWTWIDDPSCDKE